MPRNSQRPVIRLLEVLLVVAGVLVAVYIWPTRYRYDEVNINGRTVVVRRDRLTREVRWVTEEQRRHPELVPKRLPREAVLRLSATVDLKAAGDRWYWIADFHNASDWRITDLFLEITHNDLIRRYTAPCRIEPRSNGICRVLLSPDLPLGPRRRVITPKQIKEGTTQEQRLWLILGGYGFPTHSTTRWKR